MCQHRRLLQAAVLGLLQRQAEQKCSPRHQTGAAHLPRRQARTLHPAQRQAKAQHPLRHQIAVRDQYQSQTVAVRHGASWRTSSGRRNLG